MSNEVTELSEFQKATSPPFYGLETFRAFWKSPGEKTNFERGKALVLFAMDAEETWPGRNQVATMRMAMFLLKREIVNGLYSYYEEEDEGDSAEFDEFVAELWPKLPAAARGKLSNIVCRVIATAYAEAHEDQS